MSRFAPRVGDLMTFMQTETFSKAEPDYDGLWDLYVEHVDCLRDSYAHKAHMLSDDRCFKEWCEERPEKDE